MRLKGKLAVVTAGASGMGRAGALLFAKEGLGRHHRSERRRGEIRGR